MTIKFKVRAFKSVAGGTVAALALVHGIHPCPGLSGIKCLPHIEFSEGFIAIGGTAVIPTIVTSTSTG